MSLWLRQFTHTKRFKKRYDVINYFLCTRNFSRFLEIGTSNGRNLERVRCPHKVGVDPNPRQVRSEWRIHRMTSDTFFEANNEKFDLVFIDGLHTAEQVLRDIYNSLAVLNPGGVLVLHDCNPQSRYVQLVEPGPLAGQHWNGDVWKAFAFVRQHESELFCRVFSFDQGVGVIVPKQYDNLPRIDPDLERTAGNYFNQISWDDLEANRVDWLGLIADRWELESNLEQEGFTFS